MQAALDAFGRLDVVVNNAGYADLASVEDMTEKAFRDQIEAVFFGTVHTTKAALPILREQGGGHIINVTSVGSRMATPGPVRIPERQVGHGRLLGGARRRGRSARHPRDLARARGHGDRLGRVVDDRAADQ